MRKLAERKMTRNLPKNTKLAERKKIPICRQKKTGTKTGGKGLYIGSYRHQHR
jgi:hypothetical protein